MSGFVASRRANNLATHLPKPKLGQVKHWIIGPQHDLQRGMYGTGIMYFTVTALGFFKHVLLFKNSFDLCYHFEEAILVIAGNVQFSFRIR